MSLLNDVKVFHRAFFLYKKEGGSFQLVELFYPSYFSQLELGHILRNPLKLKNIFHASLAGHRKYLTHTFPAQEQGGETTQYRILDWRLFELFYTFNIYIS